MKFSNPVVLAGHSGSGKTSILHAIEWGLFGKILGFKGSGFTDEDAYVNMFSGDSKATVELDFILSGERTLFIKRSRRKAKKTTIGKNKLEVWFQGEEHDGKGAQTLIENLLKLDHEKFTQAVFLHQDMIRKFVEGGPKDRSEIIDQLLGLKNLREFTESLDPKRKIQKEIKILQEVKKSLEEQKKAVELESKERLDQQEIKLIEDGYNKKELNFKNLDNVKNSLIPKLDVILVQNNLESSFQEFEISDTKTANAFRKQMDSLLLAVERGRSNNISKCQKEIIQIRQNIKQLDQMESKANGKSIEKLKQNNLILEQEIKLQENQKRDHLKTVEIIEKVLNEYNYINLLFDRKKMELERIEGEYGEYQDIIADKDENLRDLQRLENEIKKEDSLSHVFSSAFLYISETKADDCPVCKQEIDTVAILKELQTQTTTSGKRLISIKKEIEEIKKENKKIFSILARWQDIQREIDLIDKQMAKIIQRLRDHIGFDNVSPQSSKKLMNEAGNKILELENEISEKKLEKRKNEQEISECEENNKIINRLKAGLEKQIPCLSSNNYDSLHDVAKFYIKELESKVKQLQATLQLDYVREKLERIGPIIDYLTKLEDFEHRMGEDSLIDKKIDALSYKIVKLDALENSLQTIRELLSIHQNDLTNKSLEEFEHSINDYYGKIIGHPIFRKIKIKPIAEEPVSYDLLAYDEEGEFETHVNTRFSTGQANVAALSLFFAINQKLAENLPLLIIDDPTQNLDASFQDALVDTLKSLVNSRQLLLATHERKFADNVIEKLKPGIDLILMDKLTIDGSNPKYAEEFL